MTDTNLNNDQVKLVEYSIVSIERDRERKLYETEKIVVDNMTGEAFATWVIAEFVQEQPHRVTHQEKKYLRVYYNVLDSWARESLHFESKQLDALEGIRRAIVQCCADPRFVARLTGRAEERPPAAPPRPAPPPAVAAAAPALPPAVPAPPAALPAPSAPPVPLTAEERRTLAALRQLGGEAASGQIQKQSGLPIEAVRRSLRALQERGLVQRRGQGLATRYRAVGT